jgi:FKBP-type peptidyl-prolyl cis-trans isomerase SlyD
MENIIVEKTKIVSVTYELKVSDKKDDQNEKLMETATYSNPLEFPFGVNLLLPEFEKALEGKKVGDSFETKISPENGYGYFNNQMLINIPKSTFEVDGKVDPNILQIGNSLPMQADNGQVINAIVKEIKNTEVLMDFNHPLAGKHLHFTGEIIQIREATEEEKEKMKQINI